MLLLLWLKTVRGGDCKTTRAIPTNASLLDHGIAKTDPGINFVLMSLLAALVVSHAEQPTSFVPRPPLAL